MYLLFFLLRRGNCKLTTLGQKCEIGLRRKTYNVLAGSVLSVWTKVEEVLTHDGNKRGQDSKMQVRKLFSQSSTDVPALLPCALLPRQARGTFKKQFTKPSV